jgi:hypothetical protein
MVTTRSDGTILMWNSGCELTCSFDQLQEFARGRVTRELTPVERQQYLHETPTQ